MKKRLCIVGGGAAGLSLAWLATRSPRASMDWEVTLLHDEPHLGGHSHTIRVPLGGRQVPVDIGVQFVSKTVYPHVTAMLELEEMASRVVMEPMPPLTFAAAFTEDINWTTHPRYQRDARFARTADREHARELMRDLSRALFTLRGGKHAAGLTFEEYLCHKPHLRDSDFFRFGLVPLLSIINGYTAYDILETRLGDLFPISTKLPFLPGPLIPFDRPGEGWMRFRDGAQSWIEAMAELSRARGARILASSPVRQVRPARGGVDVGWNDREERFDAVVLTTDMSTNRELLAGGRLWDRQAPFLAAEKFPLLPGVCFIHQDDSILAPHLRDDQLEDVQFTGAYAWNESGTHPYGLPYDLHSTFATHFIHNAFPGLSERCYVTMYAEAQAARFPDPAKTLHRKEWRHGRWMSSFFKEGKEQLHRIQGLGGVWFAGNNTTFDAEEGALLSAIGVAEKLFNGFESPFGRLFALRKPHGIPIHRYFVRNIMFPSAWTLQS